MAAGTTRLSDLIVPEIFAPYVLVETAEKSRIISSGAVDQDERISNALAGAGATFQLPSYRDLDNDSENISTDDPASDSSPNKIATQAETQVRLSRNNSWSSMDLNTDLIANDPLQAITSRVSAYWGRRAQAMLIATMKGVFANNDTATDAFHEQYDLTKDISGASFVDGTTNFNSSAFIDACLTMGDSMEDLQMVFVHSIVYGRMLKLQLIDFIPDATNPLGAKIPTYLGRTVIVDDSMPFTGGVFETWLFGTGALAVGMGSPKVPVEVDRKASAGNGGGQDILHSRVEWCLHPKGHAYVGTAPTGGPSNAATANNLAAAGSWRRAFKERKQIRIARLKTREM